MSDSATREIDLVLFEVAGMTFGADVADVSRIGAPLPENRRVERLGIPRHEKRALVVTTGGTENDVPIDRLVGFRRVNSDHLRRLPSWAVGLTEPAIVGFFIDEHELLVLLDLEALVKEGRPAEPDGALVAANSP